MPPAAHGLIEMAKPPDPERNRDNQASSASASEPETRMVALLVFLLASIAGSVWLSVVAGPERTTRRLRESVWREMLPELYKETVWGRVHTGCEEAEYFPGLAASDESVIYLQLDDSTVLFAVVGPTGRITYEDSMDVSGASSWIIGWTAAEKITVCVDRVQVLSVEKNERGLWTGLGTDSRQHVQCPFSCD